MVQIGIMDDFNHNDLEWYGATITTKHLVLGICSHNLTKNKIHILLIKASDKATTRKRTKRVFKVLEVPMK